MCLIYRNTIATTVFNIQLLEIPFHLERVLHLKSMILKTRRIRLLLSRLPVDDFPMYEFD